MSDLRSDLARVIRGAYMFDGDTHEMADAVLRNFDVTPKPKMDFLLAVGGPKDGQRLEIQVGTPTAYCMELNDDPGARGWTHTYLRRRLAVGGAPRGRDRDYRDVLVWAGRR